jgi:transposase
MCGIVGTNFLSNNFDKSIDIIKHRGPENQSSLIYNNNQLGHTRLSIIEKISSLLTKKASVKRKRNPIKVAASVGKIFAKYGMEKFFIWNIGENGELNWEINHAKVRSEEELDGCYAIKTNAPKESFSKEDVVDNYRNLQKIEQAFKNMKTVMLELRPVYHKRDDRIEAHVFLVMLAYYLQWHAKKRLNKLFQQNQNGKTRRWTFKLIVERLKSIRKTQVKLKDIHLEYKITQPDNEQKEILNLLNVNLS